MKGRFMFVLLLAFIATLGVSSIEARRHRHTSVNINIGETQVYQPGPFYAAPCYAVPVTPVAVPVAPYYAPVTPYYYGPVYYR